MAFAGLLARELSVMAPAPMAIPFKKSRLLGVLSLFFSSVSSFGVTLFNVFLGSNTAAPPFD